MIFFFTFLFQVTLAISSSNIIYSNDTLSLSLSSNTRNLVGSQSSRHSLEFLLKNSGSSGHFLIGQQSPHGVVGRLVTESVLLQNGQFVTLKVDDIFLPEANLHNPEFTLQVQKKEYVGSDLGDWRYEFEDQELEDQPPGYKTAISSTVVFNVVDRPQVGERELPLANIWKTDDVCPEVEQCQNAHWKVDFSARDLGSGMFYIKLKYSDEPYKPFWWYHDFKVGSKREISGSAWISCCTEKVELEIEDVAMNKVAVVAEKDSSLRWGVIVPVVVCVAIVIAVLIIIVGVCVCKKKYSTVSQTYV